jgi:hypothetical protein
LADRGSDSTHHCGDCGSRAAVNSGGRTEVSNLANIDSPLKIGVVIGCGAPLGIKDSPENGELSSLPRSATKRPHILAVPAEPNYSHFKWEFV